MQHTNALSEEPSGFLVFSWVFGTFLAGQTMMPTGLSDKHQLGSDSTRNSS